MSNALSVEGNEVTGEIALDIAPGTRSSDIDRLIEQAIGGQLHDIAEQMGAVLSTYPSRFAKPLPGKDDAGKTRYSIKARREGGRLVPAHREPKLK